jgi:hypothetical protein
MKTTWLGKAQTLKIDVSAKVSAILSDLSNVARKGREEPELGVVLSL